MKIDPLRYFLKIVEDGSFSKAAVSLGVAQPALSQHVPHLEAELKVTLLLRSRRGVTATPAGEILCEHVRTILRQMEQARLDVQTLDQSPRGEVVVGLASSMADIIAVPLVRAVARQFPEIRLRLEESMSIRTAEAIVTGRVDFGLVPNGHLIADVAAEQIVTEELYLGGHVAMPLASDQPINFAEACRVGLVLPSRPHYLRTSLEELAITHGVALDVVADQDSARIIGEFLADQLAYSILPWQSFYRQIKAGRFFARRIVKPNLERVMTIAWRQNKYFNRAAIEVRNILRQQVIDLVEQQVLRGQLSGGPGGKTQPVAA